MINSDSDHGWRETIHNRFNSLETAVKNLSQGFYDGLRTVTDLYGFVDSFNSVTNRQMRLPTQYADVSQNFDQIDNELLYATSYGTALTLGVLLQIWTISGGVFLPLGGTLLAAQAINFYRGKQLSNRFEKGYVFTNQGGLYLNENGEWVREEENAKFFGISSSECRALVYGRDFNPHRIHGALYDRETNQIIISDKSHDLRSF